MSSREGSLCLTSSSQFTIVGALLHTLNSKLQAWPGWNKCGAKIFVY